MTDEQSLPIEQTQTTEIKPEKKKRERKKKEPPIEINLYSRANAMLLDRIREYKYILIVMMGCTLALSISCFWGMIILVKDISNVPASIHFIALILFMATFFSLMVGIAWLSKSNEAINDMKDQ